MFYVTYYVSHYTQPLSLSVVSPSLALLIVVNWSENVNGTF